MPFGKIHNYCSRKWLVRQKIYHIPHRLYIQHSHVRMVTCHASPFLNGFPWLTTSSAEHFINNIGRIQVLSCNQLSSSRDGIYVLYHSHTSHISRLSLFKCLNVLFIDYISQSLVFCACSHTRMLLTGALGIKYLSDIFLDGVKISPSL